VALGATYLILRRGNKWLSEKKEGVLSRVWHSFRGGKDVTTEEALSQTGIDIIKTKTFEERIVQFDDFTQYIEDTVAMKEDGKEPKERTPEEEVRFLATRANGIVGKLHKASIPWGTGGETGYYTEASFGWSVIYTLTLTAIQAVQYLLDQDKQGAKTELIKAHLGHQVWRPKVDKAALVDSLKYFYFKYYIQYALKMSYISWFGRDVVPTKVAMIQNMPMFTPREPIPQGVPPGWTYKKEDES